MSGDQSSLRARLRVPLLPVWVRGSIVIVTLGVVLYYSIVPAPGSGSLVTGPFGLLPYSTWLHVLAYTGLTIVFAYTTAHVKQAKWRHLTVVFVVVVTVGIIIEMVQYTLPTRSFSWVDIATNTAATSIGLLIWAALDHITQFYRVDNHNAS
jgi:hypothetical protein